MTATTILVPIKAAVTNCFISAYAYIDEAQLKKKRWIKDAPTLIERNNLIGDKAL